MEVELKIDCVGGGSSALPARNNTSYKLPESLNFLTIHTSNLNQIDRSAIINTATISIEAQLATKTLERLLFTRS